MLVIFHRFTYGRATGGRQMILKLFVAARLFHEKDTENMHQDIGVKLPETPTNCCMSGCANCVWIEYAEELSKIFKGSGDKSREIIMRKVEDPNMRAFLSLELKKLKKDELVDKI